MKNIFVILFGYVSLCFDLSAQNQVKWVDPIKQDALSGRLANDKISGYGRLPDSVNGIVRDAVWGLGTNSAGTHVDFKTSAAEIYVRYTVAGPLDMPHMPKTGVSGLDLYARDSNANWFWTPGDYKFNDTITYVFGPVEVDTSKEYQLYLPLYNTVTWMEIGVPKGATIEFVKQQKKPIVIYGTSIAQGACASRPGLAWTNLLARAMNQPVVNLGFSGNGRLERPILELVGAEESSAIILDCLPNLTGVTVENDQRIDSLIQSAVHYLRGKHPSTPIILADHSSGFNEKILDTKDKQLYEQTTKAGLVSFENLKKNGVRNLYHLNYSDIALNINSTVDYVHPNDYGMMKISDAYQKLLEQIFE